MTVYIESQWDPQRGTVTLVATSGFKSDRHAVTAPAATEEEVRKAIADWRQMYRDCGADVA